MNSSTLELPLEALVDALQMVDTAKWGQARLQILLVVQKEAVDGDGWCRLGYRAIARKAHVSDRWMHELLYSRPGRPGAWMTTREHLLLIGATGAGHRGTAVRVNPNVRGWRGVPWRVGPEELELRLQGIERRALSHTAALMLEKEDLAPRSITAALEMLSGVKKGTFGRLAPRLRTAALAGERGPLAPRLKPAALPKHFAPASTLTGFALKDPSLTREGGSEGFSQKAPEGPGARVVAALSKTLGQSIYGAPRRALDEYLEDNPDSAEAMRAHAATMAQWRKVTGAVSSLLDWDRTRLAAVVAPRPIVLLDPEDRPDVAELPDRARNVAGIGELRAAAFGTRGDTDTGTWQDGARGYEEAAEA
jgi:hypothetical protein